MKYGRFLEIGKGVLHDQLSFVAKAIADDETRYFMQYLRIEEIEGELLAVATDGRRIHVVEKLNQEAQAEGLEVGAWAVKKRTGRSIWLAEAKDAGTFPEWRKVFKDDPPAFEGKWRGMTKYGAALFELCYSFPEPTALNIGYLEDIGSEDWTVKWWKPDAGVLFAAKDRRALIMTINIDRGNFLRSAISA